MDSASIKAFFGVPVLVQLKFPLAQVHVKGKSAIPYADSGKESQWIPEEAMRSSSDDPNDPNVFPVVTELVRFAVLRQLSEPGTLIEMVWSTIGPMRPGAKMPTTVTIATLIDSRDIVAVTRVVEVPDPEKAPLIITGR